MVFVEPEILSTGGTAVSAAALVAPRYAAALFKNISMRYYAGGSGEQGRSRWTASIAFAKVPHLRIDAISSIGRAQKNCPLQLHAAHGNPK